VITAHRWLHAVVKSGGQTLKSGRCMALYKWLHAVVKSGGQTWSSDGMWPSRCRITAKNTPFHTEFLHTVALKPWDSAIKPSAMVGARNSENGESQLRDSARVRLLKLRVDANRLFGPGPCALEARWTGGHVLTVLYHAAGAIQCALVCIVLCLHAKKN